MSVAEQSPEPHLTVLPPADAARRARPLPPDEKLGLEDLTDDEWNAFERALAER